MRLPRIVLALAVLAGVLVLADVLAGTLVEYTSTSPKGGNVRSRRSSKSLNQRGHPAVQEPIVGNLPVETNAVEEVEQTDERTLQSFDMDGTPSPSKRFSTHQHSLLRPETIELMNAPDAAIDLSRSIPTYGPECNTANLLGIKDSKSNEQFALIFTDIFKNAFRPSDEQASSSSFGAGIPWWLDEGGLIGSSRAGSMSNADDDFDFFALLPNQTAPCTPTSTTCTPDEFNTYIHRFLMVFWDRGMCINKFHPDPKLFKSNMRLMYSLQLGRDESIPPEKCFKEHKPFAHMHLGMMVDGSEKNEIETNVWAKHTTHPVDKLPLTLALPTTRCKVGAVDAPCPKDIVGYLHVRNGGEYFKKSSDGSCLLVRNKWNRAKREKAAETVENLAACGYNTMVSLAPALRANDFNSC